LHATEAHHAKEVLDVILPADHQPTKVVQPGKEPFHSPTPAVAPQGTAILRRVPALATMRCDHLNSITVGQITIQAVAVVSFIADQSHWEVVEEAVPEDAFNEPAFVGRSAFDTNRERKTVIIGESEDFRAFATLGGPDRKPPFFAPVKEASMKAPPVPVFLGRATPWPARARSFPACPPVPIAGSGGGRFGTADISWAIRATAPLCPGPTEAR